MKKILTLFLVTIITSFSFASSRKALYETHNDFLLAPSAAYGAGLYGFDNPAMLSYMKNPDMLVIWPDEKRKEMLEKSWGLFTAVPYIGFGMIHTDDKKQSTDHYRISFAGGDKSISFGMGYGWYKGDAVEQKKDIFISGLLLRPNAFFSLGVTGMFEKNSGYKEGVFDCGIHPFGKNITLFGDYAAQDGALCNDDLVSYGAIWEPWKGIRLTGRWFDTNAYTLGVHFSLGYLGFLTSARYNDSREHAYNMNGLRFGALEHTVFAEKMPVGKRYAVVELNGTMKYRRSFFWDKSPTLLSFLSFMKRAERDKTLDGVVINASGLNLSYAAAWEMRSAVLSLRKKGKKVIVYIDNAYLKHYYFASSADKVVMDPIGVLTLEGLVMGRSYFKGLLDKVGIGFRELRFLKYKTFGETFTRTDLSESDRMQMRALLGDFFKMIKQDVCAARNISPEEFKRVVNEFVIFMAEEAVEHKLVDQVASWEDIKDVICQEEGALIFRAHRLSEDMVPYEETWGEPARIALVYAVGMCSMDNGMRARSIAKTLEEIRANPKIQAVVVRVDSPGGSAVAADIVGKAIQRLKKVKPVIVSHGNVAASGGYWISVYADTIVSVPYTITGSIGVLGMWLFDKGLKEHLGISTDFVKEGTHADAVFGFSLLGITLPDRDLSEVEQKRLTGMMRHAYDLFLERVSTGRGMSSARVQELAQGRVWSGKKAQKHGLVTSLGGLTAAFDIVREKLGMPTDARLTIVEYPKRSFFEEYGRLFSARTNIPSSYIKEYLSLYSSCNGKPLAILPFEDTTSLDLFPE